MLLFELADLLVKVYVDDVGVMGPFENFMRWIDVGVWHWDAVEFENLLPESPHVLPIHNCFHFVFGDVIPVFCFWAVPSDFLDIQVKFPPHDFKDFTEDCVDFLLSEHMAREIELKVGWSLRQLAQKTCGTLTDSKARCCSPREVLKGRLHRVLDEVREQLLNIFGQQIFLFLQSMVLDQPLELFARRQAILLQNNLLLDFIDLFEQHLLNLRVHRLLENLVGLPIISLQIDQLLVVMDKIGRIVGVQFFKN